MGPALGPTAAHDPSIPIPLAAVAGLGVGNPSGHLSRVPSHGDGVMLLRAVVRFSRLSAPPPPIASWAVRKLKLSVSPGLVGPKLVPLVDEHTGDSASGSSCFKFRLVSYNILAQAYVKSSYFPHSPSSCLKWKARSQEILTALESFGANFLCIQELDELESFYEQKMESNGYSCIYIQRSGKKRDGCGIFYKPNCAELVLTDQICYNDLVNSADLEAPSAGTRTEDPCAEISDAPDGHRDDPNDDDKENLDDPQVILKRDCVGILAAFKLNDPSKHLLVLANTHIYWDPELIDVKLAQAKYLLSRVARFKELVVEKYGRAPSVIITGDFNSIPGDQVCRYMTSGRSGLPEEEHLPPISLRSLYAENGGEPAFTNFTPDFVGTLDYIFIGDDNDSSSCHLKPVSLLHVPRPDAADIAGGLPNHHHPSDHLPIGGDFLITTQATADDSGAEPALD